MWVALPSYAEAMRDVIGINGLDCWGKYQPYEEAAQLGGFRVMHEKFCIVSEFPDVLVRPVDGKLHCATGPTHRWKDGFSIYHLNGVCVPAWVVETPAEKIEVKKIIEEKNVDIRRELIRKIGIERFMLKSGAKVLDKKGDYELLSIRLSDEVPDARYLKMKNPSVGIFHCEGVEGNTVQEAINFRACLPLKGGVNWEPAKLT